ncbi:MAG: DUF6712 family protein [Dolichospermum sp.]
MEQIINTDTELQKFISVNKAFTVANMQSDIDSAFGTFILPYLSIQQYNISRNSTDPLHIALMNIAKRAVSNIAFALYLPIAKVQISNGGIAYTVERNKQATAEDKEDLRRSTQQKGFDAIDEMLRFLEQNKATFTAWANSTSYTLFNRNLIRTADEFKLIEGRRTVFLKLIPYMEDVEIELIESLIPTTLIADLKSGTVTGIKLELLEKYIRPIIANKSLAKALSAMSLVLNDNTISVFDNSSANMAKGYREANLQKIEAFKAELELTTKNRIVLLNKFIEANRTDLGLPEPVAETSKAYRNQEATRTKFF